MVGVIGNSPDPVFHQDSFRFTVLRPSATLVAIDPDFFSALNLHDFTVVNHHLDRTVLDMGNRMQDLLLYIHGYPFAVKTWRNFFFQADDAGDSGHLFPETVPTKKKVTGHYL